MKLVEQTPATGYDRDMRKEDIDDYARRRPFEPFEIRLVDGQRFRFTKLEQFVVGRTAIGALTRKGTIVLVNLGLISTVRPIRANGK